MISLITTSIKSDFLLKTAMSVKGQTCLDFEWILLIDGIENVNDSILNWIDSNIPQSKIIIKNHQGRNKALIDAHNLANYLYLGWLDDDDLLHPQCLQNCLDVILQGCQLVYTNHYKINKDGRIIESIKFGYSYRNLRELFCAFHFRLFTRNLYELVGGIDSTFKYSMDYELCLRFGKVTDFYHLDKFLYYYRIHDNRISELHKKEQQECHLTAYLSHDLSI